MNDSIFSLKKNGFSQLEAILWKDPLLAVKKILDRASKADQVADMFKGYVTRDLYIGRWTDIVCLGDSENVFACNKMLSFKVHEEDECRIRRLFGHNCCIQHDMFKSLSNKRLFNVEKRDAMLKEFFCSRHDIVLFKSRWTRCGDSIVVIRDCRSLTDAFIKCGLSPEKLAIEIELRS